ncbi:acyl carrier 1, mitochondrial-like [Olea europaea subsp. europaea]|uniref:Acyl carrier protein n=1 Tax=Olea europaea subsp. europaea TaxID=158383 RepID=A0A8S0U666_OLEEU|nr:acyl carrier 1, mitochondrial-like [Olea europaea subsp. europaea]
MHLKHTLKLVWFMIEYTTTHTGLDICDPIPERIQADRRLISASHGDIHLDKQEVIGRVLDVIKSFPNDDPSKVTPDVHFQKDLGLDSLDNVEIVMALEEEFKLEIPDKEADKIDSCHLAVKYIHNHPMAG